MRLLSTMSFTMANSSLEFRCSPSSFFFMYATLSGLSAMSMCTLSPCLALIASSVSSNRPTCPGGTAFLLSAMSSIAIVFLFPLVITILSIGCKSNSCASFLFRIRICMSPVAMSISFTTSSIFSSFLFNF